ncbi:hypothetical protein EYQ95_26050 [Lysobacter sp. N42]|nr:hypothetical protein EYQ95_26050 [Lysobacter sp. N42]
MLSYRDAEQAEEFFLAAWRAYESIDEVIARGLMIAGIVAYGRPFSGNEDHPTATPTPPFSRRALTGQELAAHDRLLELRNKAVAHSDMEYNQVESAAFADNGFVFSAAQYDPLREANRLPEFALVARLAKDQFAHGAFRESRNVAARFRPAG